MRNIRLLIGCMMSATALFCSSAATAQIISTIAGVIAGGAAAPAEGVPATTSHFNAPYGLAKDNLGNLYICDETNNVIRMVDPSGNVSLFAGNGTAGYAGDGGAATAAGCKLSGPRGVAVDGSNNVYIADYGSNAVRMVSHATGIITTIAGNGTAGAPYGMSPGPASSAHITPAGITVGTVGGATTIFVSDGSAGATPNYKVRAIIYFAAFSTYIITDVVGTGAVGTPPYGDGGLATAANLDAPRGLALDAAAANLYIADMSHNLVRKVNLTTRIISTVAGNDLVVPPAGYGGDGGPATAAAAKLSGPTGVIVDAAGNLLFADPGNNRIRNVTATGNLSTIVNNTGVAGATPYGDGGPALTANLSAPVSLAWDGATGNYYISDQGHNLVRYVNVSAPPNFTGGVSQNLVVCENSGATSINTLMKVNDADAGLTETWTSAAAALHGTAVVAYTTTSTGAILTPTGLTYTPSPGYSGNDSFKVQVSDGPLSGLTTVHVTVNPLPVVAPVAGTSSTVCVGANITFTDVTTGGTWAAANGNAGVTGGIVTGAAAGADNIYYIVTNSCGPDTVAASITVNATGAPSVLISSTLGTSTCGVPGTFSTTVSGGGATPSYQWSVSGTLVPGATNDSYTYTPIPGDVVSVLMTSSSVCAIPSTTTGSITMVAGGTVVPTISISSGIGDTVCVGVPVTFTSSITHGGGLPSYNWTVNGVPSGSGSTFIYTASATSAGDVIECTLTSSIPCASPTTAVSNDVVIQLRSASAASVSIAVSPGREVCTGSHVTFTASEIGGGSDPLLRWTRAGINVATGPTYTTVPNDGDVVYCTMHSSLACNATDTVVSNLISMTVDPVVIPVVTVTSTKTVAGVGQTITFVATVTSATPAPGYQWYVSGTAISGATTSHFVYTGTSSGTALVNCLVSSNDACNSIGISNLVSITISGVGVAQLSASNSYLKLAPNPNNGTFTMNLQSDYNETVNIVITNILGEKVKEFSTITNNTTELKIDQPAGIYFLSASTDHGRYVAKVMVN